MKTLALLGVLGLAAGGLFRSAEAQPAAAQEPAKPFGVGGPPFAQLSAASCSASACHGGGQLGKVGSEHTTWAPEVFPDGPADPHSQAYRVLFNAESGRIAKAMNIAAAHKDERCLNCHAVAGAKPETFAEGVSCGACHGPAEKWLGAHTQPGWKGLSNRVKWDEYGFVPAGNLVARAANCVNCHVGSAEQEVNHDMIAAGHPRLAFEYTRFHFSPGYRLHWTERTPQPDFEVQAWVAGQATTLRAATDLLRVRAERAAADDPKAVWPEFAGLSCYACHQSIGTDETRRERSDPKRPVGVPGWELWSNTGARVAAAHSGDAFPGASNPELRELASLRLLMNKRSPDPKAVAAQARKAVAEFDAWLVSLQHAEERGKGTRVAADTPRRITKALAANALAADREKLADHDWDALAANYLGCAATYHASGGARAVPAWAAPVRGLTLDLKFPVGKPGERFGSPAGFGPKERDRVRDRFRQLLDATTELGGNR